MAHVTVSDIERTIADAFPLEWAEPWDRVGLLAGDPQRSVTGALVTLDATAASVRRATDAGANVLVTHHPAFIEPPAAVGPRRGPAGTLFAALDAGVALINAHTNLDRAPTAQTVLPSMLGIEILHPLESSGQPMARVTVYVPAEAAGRVERAMADAGAGRIGEYERCSFSAQGEGSFTPREGTRPRVGSAGTPSSVEEERVEMVCPRATATRVIAAAREAHAYEEPLILAEDVTIARGVARLGAVCAVPVGWTLDTLARAATDVFSAVPRVWGAPETPLARVAVATGSAGSLIGDAIAAGAGALVAGEVRYHDALDAADAGLAIVEVGHDASEWPLVDVLADVVRRTQGLDAASVHAEPVSLGWWTP
jgi:putative NIF3 family GTP cyclohydrolase 1 type 2